MADEDEKVVVVDSENDKAETEVEVEVEKVDEPEAHVEEEGIPAEAGIEALKRSMEEQKRLVAEERRLRAEAEQRAYQAQLEAQQNFRHAQAATYQSVSDAITFMKAREESLHRAWVEAKTMGDFQKEAELQREMIATTQAVERLEERKSSMENVLRQDVRPVQPPQPADPIEAWASTLTPKTADWVRRNKERLQTEEGRNLVAAAHHKALGQGLRLESEAYFEAVETELGMRKPARREVVVEDEDEDDGVMSAAAAPARKSVAPPAAPVSRGGNRKGTFTLSAAEKEAAEISGVTYEEYYRNKVREQKRSK